MADMSYMPYAQRAAEIERQRKLAELLQQQYAEPIQQQTVGGFVVPTSPWQTVAKLAQAGLGAYMQGKADKSAAELKQQQKTEATEFGKKFMSAMGPQKTMTQTPVMQQDFGQAATPEDYQNMMNDPQMGLAPKRRNVSQAETPEDVQDIVNQPYVTKDVTSYKPGMSRQEAMAMLLQNMDSDNEYMQNMVKGLSGMLPEGANIGAVDPSDFTAESLAKYEQTGDRSVLKPITQAKTANLQRDKRTFIGKGGVEYTQDVVFDPVSGTSKDVGEAYISKAAPTNEGSVWTKQYIDPTTGQQRSQRMRGENPVGEPWVSGAAQAGTVSPSGVLNLTPAESREFKDQNYAIDTAYDNIQNLENVLKEVPWDKSVVGENSGKVSSAYNSAFGAVREIAKSGVLNVSEIPFLERGLDNPQAFTNLNPVGRDKIKGQINQLKSALERKRVALYKNYQQPLPADKNIKSTGNIQPEVQYDQYYSGFPQAQ
jgi:hypothetical protein